ncbi:MAG: hypothetical protein J6B90_03900 [Lachnospiraceae bacterium]|nr:hypothetical protein [Lachnospiraceae bacterium]
MQRKRYAGLLAAFLSIFVVACMAGCGTTKEPLDVTHLQIDEAGVITHTMIEDFDTSVYDVAELQAMIQEEIADYDNEFQAGNVSLVSAAMSETESNKLIVTMQFSDASAYSDFNDIDLFFGTVAEVGEKGYTLEDLVFTDASDATKTVGFSELDTSGHILIVEENIPVELPYKVLYTSGNVELLDKYTVSGTEQPEGTGVANGFYYVITK